MENLAEDADDDFFQSCPTLTFFTASTHSRRSEKRQSLVVSDLQLVID